MQHENMRLYQKPQQYNLIVNKPISYETMLKEIEVVRNICYYKAQEFILRKYNNSCNSSTMVHDMIQDTVLQLSKVIDLYENHQDINFWAYIQNNIRHITYKYYLTEKYPNINASASTISTAIKFYNYMKENNLSLEVAAKNTNKKITTAKKYYLIAQTMLSLETKDANGKTLESKIANELSCTDNSNNNFITEQELTNEYLNKALDGFNECDKKILQIYIKYRYSNKIDERKKWKNLTLKECLIFNISKKKILDIINDFDESLKYSINMKHEISY